MDDSEIARIGERVTTLERRVDVIDSTIASDTKNRLQSQQYTHHILENLQARMEEMRVDVRAGFENDVKTDREMEDRLALGVSAQDKRLRTIERLVWIGLGGIIVLGGLVSIVGNNILKVLGS